MVKVKFKGLHVGYVLGHLEPSKEAGSPLLFSKSFFPYFLFENKISRCVCVCVCRGRDPAALEAWTRAENNLKVGSDIVTLLLTLVRFGHSCASCARAVCAVCDGASVL